MTAVAYEFRVLLDRVPTAAETEVLFGLPGEPTVESVPAQGVGLVWCTQPAETLVGAVTAAVAQLEEVGLRAVQVQAQPWVTVDDIATRLGRSRAAVRQWVDAYPEPTGFPAPSDRDGLRFWPHVAGWLRDRLGYRLPDDREGLAAVNLALRLRDLSPRVPGAAHLHRLLPR